MQYMTNVNALAAPAGARCVANGAIRNENGNNGRRPEACRSRMEGETASHMR